MVLVWMLAFALCTVVVRVAQCAIAACFCQRQISSCSYLEHASATTSWKFFELCESSVIGSDWMPGLESMQLADRREQATRGRWLIQKEQRRSSTGGIRVTSGTRPTCCVTG